MFRRRSNSHQSQGAEQQQSESKVNELKVAMGPLTGKSLQYCSDACLRRYLEARSWNVDKSKKMLGESLKWRSTYKPEEILWAIWHKRVIVIIIADMNAHMGCTYEEQVSVEGETGKVFRSNFHDGQGRTVLILRPALQNAIPNLPEGQEQMSWLIDFTGWSLANSVPIKSARESVNILQNHYPERLAIAFLYNPPRIFETFWKVVKYFLDAKTFQKVKFVYPKNKDSVELMRMIFDEENLPSELGGKVVLAYDHEEISKMMARDDEKAGNMLGCDQKTEKIQSKQHPGAEVAPEPETVGQPTG